MAERERVCILRSNPISPDPRVEKIAAALSASGREVMALGWDRTAALPSKEMNRGFRVERLPIRAEYGQGMGNFPQLLRWQWGLWCWLLKNHSSFDILHACDFDTILPALWIKWLFHKKVIYDIFDFYADHLRRTPGGLKNMIRKVDLWAIGKADALILVDDSRRDQVNGSHPRRLTIVYNSPEDARSKLADPIPSRAGCELRLAYIGLLQIERGLFEMLEVLRLHPDWHLDLAGFGGDEERILALVAALPNVTWYGRVQYDQALLLSDQADALFATYDPAIANHRFSSPNKVFEAMMLGKPLVVARGTNMDRMVEAADCGLIVNYGDVKMLEGALARLAEDAELRRRLGANARQAYEHTYSWAKMRERLIQLYAEVSTQGA